MISTKKQRGGLSVFADRLKSYSVDLASYPAIREAVGV